MSRESCTFFAKYLDEAFPQELFVELGLDCAFGVFPKSSGVEDDAPR